MNNEINQGLSSKEAERLTKQGFSNVMVKNQSKTVGQIIAGNIFTYFNFIFAIFAMLLIFVRSYVNMTFLPIIISNTLIGIIQEIRSKRVLDRLSVLNAIHTKVLRDNEWITVLSETLVKGDLVCFEAGNQICADAVVCEGVVRVNEALVTGEADEILKTAGDTLLSGSFVVSGACTAKLEKVGLESYASKLMLEAKAGRKKQQTEMLRSLDSIVKVIGIIIIPIGIILYLQSRYMLHNTVAQSVVSVIASLVGMIPEGLYLLASVALVVSVIRLGKKKVLVHEMACVETLARVNVLCVDKTGTITENKMSVEQIIPLSDYDEDKEESLHQIIGDVVGNLKADNITMAALKEYFDENTGREALKVYSFSSETKYSAVEFQDESYVIGAPEKVLLQRYDEYSERIEMLAKGGARILVFGSSVGKPDGKPLKQPIEPIALIVLANPVRKEARETFEYFEEQGVGIKVISGDNPVTASEVAAKAGIKNADSYIDASQLDTDEKLAEAALKYTVFGRVSPQQKKDIVKALQADNKIVAVTGDGVNDVLALKAADCSVAMASGSEAASNAAQIVLLDSDFSCMPSVVLEGRRVVNNIQRSASLFLVKNIFSILLTLFTIIAVNRYPLYPTQLSLLGAFTIGTPAFFLALQPNKGIIKGRFIVNVVIKALPSAITDFIVVAVISVIGEMNNIGHDYISTIIIYILLTVGMLTLIRICRPFNLFRTVICLVMAAGITFSILFLKGLFALQPLNSTHLLITFAGMACTVPIFIALCCLIEGQRDANSLYHRLKKYKKKED